MTIKKVSSTLSDTNAVSSSIINDFIKTQTGDREYLEFKGIEAGPGMHVQSVPVDIDYPQAGQKIVLSLLSKVGTYFSHFNTTDGSKILPNGIINSNYGLVKTSRISFPNNDVSPATATPFFTNGWAGTDQSATNSNMWGFTPADPITGFGVNSSIQVEILDGDGSVLSSNIVNGLSNNGVFVVSPSIAVTLSGYALDGLAGPEGSANLLVSVDMAIEVASVGRTGGRFSVRITHNTDPASSNTLNLGSYVFTSNEIFYDGSPTTVSIAGGVNTLGIGSAVFKNLSGIKYYTAGSAFSLSIPQIDGHNSLVSPPLNSLTFNGSVLGLPAVQASPWVTPESLNFGSPWSTLHSFNGGTYNKTDWALTAPNRRFSDVGAIAMVTVNDQWAAPVVANLSSLDLLVDTYPDSSTLLTETFDTESKRSLVNFSGAWDSTKGLSDILSLGAPGAGGSPGVGGVHALQYGGSLMRASQSFTMSPQIGPHGGGAAGSLTDFTTLLPAGNPNYTALVSDAVYYRTWANTGIASSNFTLIIDGLAAAGGNNFTQDLINNDLQIYMYKEAGFGNVGKPPANSNPFWLHGPLDYNFATYNDGSTQSNIGSTARLGTSNTNTVQGTFGGFDDLGGLHMILIIKNNLIRIDTMTIIFM